MSESEGGLRRAVFRPVGIVTIGLGLCMAGCALIGVLMEVGGYQRTPLDVGGWHGLVWSAAVTLALGALMLVVARNAQPDPRRRRHASLAVVLIWLVASVCGGLPYVFGCGRPLADAIFESASGFTTTGATVFGNIEGTIPSAILLWRALTHWLGGMGIVVLFVAIFPGIASGAKEMFKNEVPGPTTDGLRPRIGETSVVLWQIYTALTLVQIVVMWLLGMDLFDAICHSFATVATGGFSTYDASIAHFESPAIEAAITVFMLLAGVNFSVYYAAARGDLRAVWRSTELRAYVGIVVGATVLITVALLSTRGWSDAFRVAAFQVVSFMTTTGFATDSYAVWPAPTITILLILMVIGGSAGSTSGGLKVARAVMLVRGLWNQIREGLRPGLVTTIRMDDKAVPGAVIRALGGHVTVFVALLIVTTLAVTYSDPVSPYTAFAATLSAVSNVGPSPFYVGADNFEAYSAGGKLILTVAMVLGRLEFFAALALLSPDFWKR